MCGLPWGWSVGLVVNIPRGGILSENETVLLRMAWYGRVLDAISRGVRNVKSSSITDGFIDYRVANLHLDGFGLRMARARSTFGAEPQALGLVMSIFRSDYAR